MNTFDFRDYRALVRGRIEALPKRGYGQLSRLAQHIGVNSTLVSQILAGLKNFTEDQAYRVAEFFQLSEPETFYFLLLVQHERAGNHQLKKFLEKQILAKQNEARKVKGRVSVEAELTHEQQAVFYSDWLYTAVHTLSSIREFQDVDAIAAHLEIERSRVFEVCNWLLQHGLCKETNGKIKVGPTSTFVDKNSILATRHHANWRVRGLEKMGKRADTDFFFTAPFSISKKDLAVIRQELVQLISDLAKRVEKTDPEVMATINIDLF